MRTAPIWGDDHQLPADLATVDPPGWAELCGGRGRIHPAVACPAPRHAGTSAAVFSSGTCGAGVSNLNCRLTFCGLKLDVRDVHLRYGERRGREMFAADNGVVIWWDVSSAKTVSHATSNTPTAHRIGR
ncbi:MAG: hypothetical protein ACE5E8_12345 [Acidimicrobiia bacterium]